jgi:hypothetical protein
VPVVDQQAAGIAVDPIMLNGPNEVDGAFEAIEKARAEAVIAQGTFSTCELFLK